MVMSVPQKSLSMEPTSPAMFRCENMGLSRALWCLGRRGQSGCSLCASTQLPRHYMVVYHLPQPTCSAT